MGFFFLSILFGIFGLLIGNIYGGIIGIFLGALFTIYIEIKEIKTILIDEKQTSSSKEI